jgi:hypothetical protein
VITSYGVITTLYKFLWGCDNCLLGWIECDFFLELRVAWDLKNKVLVPVNPFRNIFVFGLG